MNLLCDEVICKHRVERVGVDGSTTTACDQYPKEYQAFVTRRGYCPVVDAGPNKKKPVEIKKERAGQQKQKKK